METGFRGLFEFGDTIRAVDTDADDVVGVKAAASQAPAKQHA